MDELQWNKDRLYRLVQSKLGDSLFIVVSNREPYVHSLSGKEIKWNRPVSGLTEALDPVMRASGGTWVAQGTGDADRKVVDKHDRVAVPPDNPEYTLRRVWLTEDEVAGFYLGFSNEGLWPLCHVTFTPPVFNEDDWHTYQKVNNIFADAVIKEIGDRPAVVLVQDYHFALLSHYLKERNPDLTVGQFWHIPWPAYEVLRTCPWHEEILAGLLGNDLMGFHTQAFCNNFIESVERSLEARTVREEDTIFRQGNTTIVEPFPISVDFDGICEAAGSAAVEKEMAALKKEFHLEGKYLGIGMDRMDYTKGIPERLLALDKFLEDNSEYRGKVVFIQAGMPSRTQIDTYKEIGQRIDDLMEGINKKYGTDAWQPVVPMTRQLSHDTLNALRRLAHFCVVSSLHDGMNLVAKEYVAARVDGDGVLILSKFTGAAVEMRDALLINPFAIGEFALKIKEAIEMPEAERRRRMSRMRDIVSANNIYRWGASMVARLIEIAGV
ncbi:MAG: trehalose-6-phosphate synthase [Chloroflexota bacterium]